jgi:hypothetical protein
VRLLGPFAINPERGIQWILNRPNASETLRLRTGGSQIQAAMKRGFQTRDAEIGLGKMLGDVAELGDAGASTPVSWAFQGL